MGSSSISQSGEFLDERLCEALAVIVYDTSLRQGKDSNAFTVTNPDGERWIIAVTQAPKAEGEGEE